MSVWTHVVGCIRVDDIPILPHHRIVNDIKKILGESWKVEVNKKWNEEGEFPLIEIGSYKNCKLPKGSEGSLQYAITEYDRGLPWIAIAIWGDLRDYSGHEEIAEWWHKLLKELNWIRDATLKIHTEGLYYSVILMEDGREYFLSESKVDVKKEHD